MNISKQDVLKNRMLIDILYVDSFDNFYLFLEVAKSSKNKWLFLVFSKDKAEICKINSISYFLMPVGFNWKLSNDFIEDKHFYRYSIKRDRILKYLPYSLACRIIDNHLGNFIKLINKTLPSIVIGEISWANEHAFYFWCKKNHIRYRQISNLPLPINRIVMLDDEHSYSSLCENKLSFHQPSSSLISYQELCEKLKEFKSTNRFKVIDMFIRLLDFDSQARDYRRLWIYGKIKYIMLIFYKLFYASFLFFIRRIASIDSLKYAANGRKIIYFPLHIQPEQTPDYVAKITNNQFMIISKISEIIPDDYVILIKDHPIAYSIRNPIKLFFLIRKRNVLYARRNLASSDIIRHSTLVATIAGTAAFEALTAGVPSIVFANIYFNKSKYIKQINDYNEIPLHLQEIERMSVKIDIDLNEFGVPAFIHDPTIFPHVLNSENINAISQFVQNFLEKNSQSSSCT